jgi:hypothetical protein
MPVVVFISERLAGRLLTDLDFSLIAFSTTASCISIGFRPSYYTTNPTSSIGAMAPFDGPACGASGNANPLTTLKTTTADCSLQQDQLRPNSDNELGQTIRSLHPEAFREMTVRNSLPVFTCESADHQSQEIISQFQANKFPTCDDNNYRQIVPSPPQVLPPMTLEQEKVRNSLLTFT